MRKRVTDHSMSARLAQLVACLALLSGARPAPAPVVCAEPTIEQAMHAIIMNAAYIAKKTDNNDPAYNNVVAWFAAGDILDAAAPWMYSAPNFRRDGEVCCEILISRYPFIRSEVCER